MRVWVDDMRSPPSHYDTWAKTYEQAINLLEFGLVTSMSLDHDLGEEKTGYDIAKWIEEHALNGSFNEIGLAVHTLDPVGRANICKALQNAKKAWWGVT